MKIERLERWENAIELGIVEDYKLLQSKKKQRIETFTEYNWYMTEKEDIKIYEKKEN